MFIKKKYFSFMLFNSLMKKHTDKRKAVEVERQLETEKQINKDLVMKLQDQTKVHPLIH